MLNIVVYQMLSYQSSWKQCCAIVVYAMCYSLINWWVWKHNCRYQCSWDKPYSPGCNHLCPMLQFGSKHVCIEDVHIFKHCHEMTLFLLWIGTCCISCVVQQTSGVKDLPSLVTYDDSSLAAIRHVRSIVPVLRPHPDIRSHSVLFYLKTICFLVTYLFHSFRFELYN